MSKVVDERVVEMRFDNSQFERGVASTMSTLDKFKQKLNFKGASKGLEDISAAAQKVDMRGLSSGVETVTAKFSALQVMGVTALANITNSAVNTGKTLVKSLTIDQVTAGWNKFEQKTESIQTIMNATGKSIDEVNSYLDKLMWYSDETSYGFTDMTQSLGQLTSAGGDIEKLIPMIEGIANATAFAGKGSAEFSRAIYNLNQSYSAGHLQYMDWKSLDLAGVSSKQLKQTFIDTAKALGKLDAEGKTAGGTLVELGNFGQTLQEKWADTEVMEAAFGKFADLTEAVYEAVDAGEYDTASEAIAALGDKYDEIAVKAFSSAQEAKSFTEAIDATKDAVSSGWMNTAELIFGNYAEAKTLWTDMANSLWDIFASGSETRNEIVGDAMNSKWDKLIERMEDAGVSAETFQEKIIETAKEHGIAIDDLIDEYGSLGKVISAGKLSKNVIVETIKKFAENVKTVGEVTSVTTDKLEHFQGLVNKVINGDFGNGTERIEKLTKAGENYATVQGLVNKIWERNGKNWSDTTLKAEDLTEVINDLSESELESIGYTDEQAKALKELAKEAEETGTPLNELIEQLDKPSGRELLFSSIHNAFEGIIKVLDVFKSAWGEIFTSDRMSAGLYKLLEGINRFTERMIMSDETADNLQRTIKGLVALIDILQTILGGGLRFAFKIISRILAAFDMDILDVTAKIGDAIVNFRDWVNSILDFEDVLNKVIPYLTIFVDKIKDVFNTFKQSKFLNNITSSFKKLINYFKKLAKLDISNLSFGDIAKNIVDTLKTIPTKMKEIGVNIIEGLQNGIDHRFHNIINTAKDVSKKLIDTVCKFLGIHSPSTVFFEIGKNIVQGLINGIAAGLKFVVGMSYKLGSAIIDFFKDIDLSPITDKIKAGFSKFSKTLEGFDWKKLLAVIPIGVILVVVKELYDFSKAITEGLGSVNKVIEGFADIENSISKLINAQAFETAAEGMKKIATSIAILAGSIWILSTIEDPKRLYGAVVILLIMSVVIQKMAKAVASLQSASAKIGKDGIKIAGLKTGLLTIGAALLMLAATVKILSGIDFWSAVGGLAGLTLLMGALVGFFYAYGSFVKGKAAMNIDKAGVMLLKMSISLAIMVGVMKLIGLLKPEDVGNGVVFIMGFLMFVQYLVQITTIGKYQKIAKLSGLLMAISASLILMIGVFKLVGLLNPQDVVNGIFFIGGFTFFIWGLVQVTQIGKESQIAKLGGLLLSISVSIMLMAGAFKLIRLLELGDVVKGTLFLAGFLGFMWLLIKVTTVTGEQKIARVAATLLAMSVAIAILAGVAVLLSMMPDQTALLKSAGAIAVIGVVMAAMIWATRGAEKCIGNIIALSVAVGILAAVVYVLGTMVTKEQLDNAINAMIWIMSLFGIIMIIGGQMPNVALTLLAMAVAVGILGGVLYLLKDIPADNALGSAIAISIVMLVFAGVLKIISGMQGVSGMALVTIGVMTLVVAALGGVLYLLQGVNPTQGIAIVGVISVFLAALMIALSAMSLIPAPALIGLGALAILTLLVAALAGVLYLLQSVDPTQAIQMVGVITAFLLAMEVVCVAAGGLGLLAGPAIAGLGILVGFIAALGLVVIGLAKLAMDVIAGMPKLGSDLSAFMTNVQPFIDGIQSIPEGISDKVGTLCTAILKLTGTNIVDAIGSILTGGNSLSDLGKELKTFGEGMAMFASSMGNIDGAVVAIGKIKDIQEAIPSDIDLSPLESIGKSLQSYSLRVTLLNLPAIDASIVAARRLSTLGTELASVDFSGVSNFNIIPLGTKIAGYSLIASTINAGAITASINAAKQIKNFITSLVGMDSSGIAGFKSAVDQLSKVSISKVVDAFKSGGDQLYKTGSDLINSFAKGMRSAQSGLVQTTKTITSLIRSAMVSQTALFVTSGKMLAAAFGRGLTSAKGQIIASAKTMASGAASATKDLHGDFYSAGSYLAEGFADGIDGSAFEAKTAAVAMATAALEAAKEALGIDSPSKEAAKIGEYFVEGFINGIQNYTKTAYDSSAELAKSANKGLSDAIAKIRSVVDNDLDTQPTIQPVMDLSNVKSGIEKIGSWFTNSPSFGANVDVGAISSAVNQRVQNGTNNDVVSAIDKLNKKFDTLSQPSYSIEGITYSGDSEVSDAIQTLIRAAKMDRRV